MKQQQILQYAFLWSIIRLVFASTSLFFGAVPIAYTLKSTTLFADLLPLAWVVSGAAAAYLAYISSQNNHQLFGTNTTVDKAAFGIMVVSGINLGLVAIVHNNIGMSFFAGLPFDTIIFKATGIVYLFVAYHLFSRWKQHHSALF